MTIDCKKLLKGFTCVTVCLFGMQQAAFSKEAEEKSEKSRNFMSKGEEKIRDVKKAVEESRAGKIALKKYGQAKEIGQDLLRGGKESIEEMIHQAVCTFNMQPLQSLQAKVEKLQKEVSAKKASLKNELNEIKNKKRTELQQKRQELEKQITEKRQELEMQISKLKAEFDAKLDAKTKEEDEKLSEKAEEVNEKITDKMEDLQESKSMLDKMREKCNIPAGATGESGLSAGVKNALPTSVSSNSSRSSRRSSEQ